MATVTLKKCQGQPLFVNLKELHQRILVSLVKIGQAVSDKNLKVLAYMVTVTLKEGQGQSF